MQAPSNQPPGRCAVKISYMSASSTTLSPNPWARILDALEKKINRHSYDTWLKPTRYSHASGGILFVRVPTVEFRHAGDKYADLIQEAIDNLGLGFNDVKLKPSPRLSMASWMRSAYLSPAWRNSTVGTRTKRMPPLAWL